MTFDYKIVNYRWGFCTKFPLVDNCESELFRDDNNDANLQWKCDVKSVEILPIPQGEKIKATREQNVYLEGKYVWLELLNRETGQPFFVTKYHSEIDDDIQLWILDGMRPYTLRMEHIWSAVDFPNQLLKKNILTLHSAVIEYKEQAILFLAPSCTGKSTQAKLWERLRGAIQLNGDKAAVCCVDETVKAFGLPFCGTSNICKNYEMPVKALVVLGQAKENRVTRLSGIKALTCVASNCFGHKEIPGCGQKIFQLLIKVLEKVPVYYLECTPDKRAVEALEAYLQEG